MTPLPSPRWDISWAKQLTQWLSVNIGSQVPPSVDRPGTIFLVPNSMARVGEVPCDGGLYLRGDFPELFKAIGTTFATGGESAAMFRVPNIASPVSGAAYRIKTGA